MKKMYKYIMTVAIVLMGLLQFTSCNDANDWTVDTSVVKQRPPKSFKVELKDIRGDENGGPLWKGTIGLVAGAKSYEVQMSKSPLTPNSNLPVDGEIYTMKVDFDTDEGDLDIDQESSAGFPRLEQNNNYYFRVRAIGEDGTVSNWFTNGKLYNGGVTDEALEQRLIAHTYEYNTDINNSYATFTVPPILRIGNADVGENDITVRWHEIKYAEIKYLRNDTDGGELIDISSKPSEDGEVHPDYDNVKEFHHTVTGLEPGKEYSFSLIASDGVTVLSTATATTETTPNMEWALNINDWGTIATGEDVTVRDETGMFKIDIDGKGAKIKTETGKTDKYYNPVRDIECPMANGKRLTTGGKNGSMTITLPAVSGRLYAYTHVGSSGAGRQMLVNKLSNSELAYLPPSSKDANGAYVFQKIYITDDDIDKENNNVTIKVTWSASIYICGFTFVPDKEIPTSTEPITNQPTE